MEQDAGLLLITSIVRWIWICQKPLRKDMDKWQNIFCLAQGNMEKEQFH